MVFAVFEDFESKSGLAYFLYPNKCKLQYKT